MLYTLRPVSSLPSPTEEEEEGCQVALGVYSALPSPCSVTLGKVFAFSLFCPLNWGEKMVLTVGRSVGEPWPIARSRSRCSGPPDAVIPYYYWVVSAGLVKQLVCVPELVVPKELWP